MCQLFEVIYLKISDFNKLVNSYKFTILRLKLLFICIRFPPLGRADENREFCGALYRQNNHPTLQTEQLVAAIYQEKLVGDGFIIPIGRWEYWQLSH